MPSIIIRALPPSINSLYGRRGSRVFLSRHAQQFGMQFLMAMNEAKTRHDGQLYIRGPVRLSIVFYLGTRRIWDADNHVKYLQDIASSICFGPGDDCVQELRVRKVYEPGIEPYTVMTWESAA